MLDSICKQLGIEFGVEWAGDDYNGYKVDKDGNLFIKDSSEDVWMYYNEGWPNLVSGKLKPVWKPKNGDIYYTPTIQYLNDKYTLEMWTGDMIDFHRLENKLVFKTEKEAIDSYYEILGLWKQNNLNESGDIIGK